MLSGQEGYRLQPGLHGVLQNTCIVPPLGQTAVGLNALNSVHGQRLVVAIAVRDDRMTCVQHLLGNVGTIMCGRIGVTDAELMEKAFQPVFNAEDLHKIPNHEAVTTVLMFGLPTSPFTLKLLPPLGESSEELMHRMREYALSRFGRPRAEVEEEIERRLAATDEPKPAPAPAPVEKPAMSVAAGGTAVAAAKPAAKPAPSAAPKTNFLDAWLEKKAKLEKQAREEVKAAAVQQVAKPEVVKPAVKPSAPAAHPSVAAVPKVAQQQKRP